MDIGVIQVPTTFTVQQPRLSAADFYDAGLALLERDGFPAVTGVALCDHLGVTRGSFYHHFASHDVFIAGMINHWIDRWTRDTIAAIEQITNAEGRHEHERTVLRAMPHGAEAALRTWGSVEPRAREALRRVDALRRDYLVRSLRSRGADVTSAPRLADAVLATLIGAQLIDSQPDAGRIGAIMDTVWDLLCRFIDDGGEDRAV